MANLDHYPVMWSFSALQVVSVREYLACAAHLESASLPSSVPGRNASPTCQADLALLWFSLSLIGAPGTVRRSMASVFASR